VVAKAATATIPIVFAIATDSVRIGFVASLDRPGGNITGVANLNVEVGPKRLELLHELLREPVEVARLNGMSVLPPAASCRCLSEVLAGYGIVARSGRPSGPVLVC
jgi:hypothetical protein